MLTLHPRTRLGRATLGLGGVSVLLVALQWLTRSASGSKLKGNGEVSRLEISGTVVGLFDGATYAESTIAIEPGDIFVAFTDGVTEPENESGEFGEERLIDLIREHRHQTLSRIGDLITGSVAEWIGGAEQPDDITVVLARAR